jgi:long-chain fatty acid transport protein
MQGEGRRVTPRGNSPTRDGRTTLARNVLRQSVNWRNFVRKLAALAVLLPSLAFASGYALPNTNPRDLSLSASAVAAQRDSGAAFALPAALGRIDGWHVSVGAGVVSVFDEWTDPTPGATVARLGDPAEPGTDGLITQYTLFPNISASYGGKASFLGDRRWGVGLGLQPFGGAIVKWPTDWAGRYRITDVNRQVFSGILSAGVEVIPQIRIGGGVLYYYTMQTLKQKVWMQPYPLGTAGTATAPDATAKLDISGGQVSWDASIEIDPVKDLPLTFAFDYKHQAVQKLDGDVTWSDTGPYVNGPPPTHVPQLDALFNATKAKETLTIPNSMQFAVSYRASKPLLLTGTFTLDRWVVYKSDTFDANTGAVISVPRNYKNGQTYRVGAEYAFNRTWEARAGLQRDISGLDKNYYSPTLPDSSSWAGSLGGTFRFGDGFSIDAAVFYALMDQVKAQNVGAEPGAPTGAAVPPVYLTPQDNTSFRGTYNPAALVYTLAVGWTPGAK